MKSFLVMFAILVLSVAPSALALDANQQEDLQLDDFFIVGRAHGTIQLAKEVKELISRVSKNEIYEIFRGLGRTIYPGPGCVGKCYDCYVTCRATGSVPRPTCVRLCGGTPPLKNQVDGDIKDDSSNGEVADQVFKIKNEEVIFTGPRKLMQ